MTTEPRLTITRPNGKCVVDTNAEEDRNLRITVIPAMDHDNCTSVSVLNTALEMYFCHKKDESCICNLPNYRKTLVERGAEINGLIHQNHALRRRVKDQAAEIERLKHQIIDKDAVIAGLRQAAKKPECTTCQGPGFINQADLFSGCPDCKGSGLSQKKAAKVILDNPMGTWQEAMLHDHEAQLEEQAVRLKELESTGRHHNARMLELEQHQGRDRADLTNEILNQKRQIEYVSQTVRDLGAPVSKLENAQTAQQEKPVEPEMVICNQSTCCGNTICHCHEPHPRCSHCKKQYCNYFDAKTQCMPVKRG